MKKINGIVAKKDGSYTLATLIKTETGWKLHKSETWDLNKTYKRHFLFHKGIHIGIESHWIQKDSVETDRFVTVQSDGNFIVCTQSFQLQLFNETFDLNLLGIHPDDMFLCTLPIHTLNNPASSFVSIFQEEQFWKIAVILNRRISVTFNFPITATSKLHCCLARIEQYWLTLNTDTPFPDTVYLFNDQKLKPGDRYSVININFSTEDPSILKAMGVAFCAIDPAQPAFSGPTDASKSRKKRAMLYLLSSSLIILSLLCSGSFFFINRSLKSDIAECQQEYDRILTDNKEIRDLIAQGEALAAKLGRIEKLSASVSYWSKFLHHLGLKRPSKLFLDRLGSEPVTSSGNDKKVRIVLSGWADNETTVTDLIKNLNTIDMISEISLSSMERDKKKKDYCRFKIICTVILSKS